MLAANPEQARLFVFIFRQVIGANGFLAQEGAQGYPISTTVRGVCPRNSTTYIYVVPFSY